VARRKCAWMSRPSFVLQSTTFGPLRPAPTDSRGSCSRQPSSFFTDLRRLSKAVTGGGWTDCGVLDCSIDEFTLWKSGRGCCRFDFRTRPSIACSPSRPVSCHIGLQHRFALSKKVCLFRPPLVARVPACSIRPSPVCRGATARRTDLCSSAPSHPPFTYTKKKPWAWMCEKEEASACFRPGISGFLSAPFVSSWRQTRGARQNPLGQSDRYWILGLDTSNHNPA